MTSRIKQGARQIIEVFATDKTAFMPYFTLGYPDMKTSIEVVKACVENGADIIELGIPFSDPLADGPTIQHSTQVALENGTTVAACLDAVKELRDGGISIPLILMGYYNPMLAYGIDQFVNDAAASGANGFIVPDLPPEEAEELLSYCHQEDSSLIFLLSPNSTDERIEKILAYSNAFTYLVSVTGITGERNTVSEDTILFIKNIRRKTDQPLAVGFGISTPEQAKSIAQIADGVIVGSALIKVVRDAKNKPEAAGKFVAKMVAATEGSLTL